MDLLPNRKEIQIEIPQYMKLERNFNSFIFVNSELKRLYPNIKKVHKAVQRASISPNEVIVLEIEEKTKNEIYCECFEYFINN